MKKILIALITVLLCFPAVKVNAAAAAVREVGVYLYHDYTDCVFMINWENTERKAVVEVRNPEGVMMNANPQSTTYSEGQAYVSVGTAKSGYWIVNVRGSNLGTINVSGGSINSTATQHNIIQSFSAEFSNGYVNFKWNAVTDRQNTVNVSIYAVQGANYYRRRSVWHDYDVNKNGAASISADDLSTGLYFFTIEVYDGNSQYTLSTDEPL